MTDYELMTKVIKSYEKMTMEDIQKEFFNACKMKIDLHFNKNIEFYKNFKNREDFYLKILNILSQIIDDNDSIIKELSSHD